MTSACHLGKFLCQNCVNMAVGMGLFGPCLGWNRACSRSLQPGSVAVVIVPGLARLIKQSRETRTGEQENGTGAQRPCPSPCMPGRISLCRSMPVREGHPSTGGSRCTSGAGHTNGPIRFRQQLSSSTSGSAPSLRRQGQRIRGCVFSGREADGFPTADRQSRRQQQPLFWVDFFSGQDGILQQGRTYNRVPGRASRAQGHPQGALLRGQVVATGQDIQADRSVSVNNYLLLPLATC